jgi:large subunit ribosomal protein L3
MIDDRPGGVTEGMEISVPVTVVESPPITVIGLRAYQHGAYGSRVIAEAWADKIPSELDRRLPLPKKSNSGAKISIMEKLVSEEKVHELRAIVATFPSLVPSISQKTPEVSEIVLNGNNVTESLEKVRNLLGKPVNVTDVLRAGQLIDVTAVTKGKGTQGPVKRWGVAKQKHKHSRAGKLRHIGNLGPWHPHHVRWTVPQAGQMGYHQRTEYNKRIILMGDDSNEINPAGGFLNYGNVANDYLLIKGSIPGPVKRLIRLRPAIRAPEKPPVVPEIAYISKSSKQGA